MCLCIYIFFILIRKGGLKDLLKSIQALLAIRQGRVFAHMGLSWYLGCILGIKGFFGLQIHLDKHQAQKKPKNLMFLRCSKYLRNSDLFFDWCGLTICHGFGLQYYMKNFQCFYLIFGINLFVKCTSKWQCFDHAGKLDQECLEHESV